MKAAATLSINNGNPHENKLQKESEIPPSEEKRFSDSWKLLHVRLSSGPRPSPSPCTLRQPMFEPKIAENSSKSLCEFIEMKFIVDNILLQKVNVEFVHVTKENRWRALAYRGEKKVPWLKWREESKKHEVLWASSAFLSNMEIMTQIHHTGFSDKLNSALNMCGCRTQGFLQSSSPGRALKRRL